MKTPLSRIYVWALPALPVLFTFIIIASCKKTQTASPPQTADARLNTNLMNSTNFVALSSNLDREDFADMMDNSAGRSNLREPEDNCRTVTYNTSQDVYPHTKTITSDDCEKCDGSIVNGAKIITYYVDPKTAKPGDLLSVKTYKYYWINNENVTGTVSTFLVSGNPYVLRVVANKTIIEPGPHGGKKSYTSNNTWTQIAGANTSDQSDDVYSITGSAAGTENLYDDGFAASFTSAIDPDHPIINSNDCCWNTKGTVNIAIAVITHGGYTLKEVLDFGDGSCDDQATLSINGGEWHTVTLPLRFFPLENDN